jgi:H-type lectin domain
MPIVRAVGISLVLSVITAAANAANDLTTQVGMVDCDHGSCPTVTFPNQFGGVPTVVLSYNGLRYFFLGTAGTISYNATATAVTPSGFTPVIQTGGDMDKARLSWVAVGPALLPGTVTPSYIVLTVVYAPPGTNNGNNGNGKNSNVEYAAGSTTGTTTSSSKSFKASNTLSFEGSGGFLGNDTGGGVSFSFSRSSTDTQSLDVKKTINSKITVGGPAHDGIDRNEDEIWLLLRPDVDLAVSSSTAQWTLSSDNSQKHVQYLQVGQLNGNPHYSIPKGVADELASAGITAAEYPNILKHDPLACQDWSKCGSSPNISPSIDPKRFNLISCQLAYEPPGSSTGSASPVQSWQQSNSSTSTVSQTVVDDYTVGLSMTQSGDYLGFAKAQLKDSASWTWSNKSENSTTTGTSESATLSIGGPAFGYKGPTALCAYFDGLYKTFAFDLVGPQTLQLAVQGALTNKDGNPESYTEVDLIDRGVKQVTFTNAQGEYTFYGNIGGATIEAAGVPPQTIPRSPPPRLLLRKQ